MFGKALLLYCTGRLALRLPMRSPVFGSCTTGTHMFLPLPAVTCLNIIIILVRCPGGMLTNTAKVEHAMLLSSDLGLHVSSIARERDVQWRSYNCHHCRCHYWQRVLEATFILYRRDLASADNSCWQVGAVAIRAKGHRAGSLCRMIPSTARAASSRPLCGCSSLCGCLLGRCVC